MSRQDEQRSTPTRSQKAALAGTSGTPSAANRFVTNTDARNSDAREPTAHASTHEADGEDPIGFHAFDDEPPAVSPSVDGYWLQHDGGSPDSVSLRVRVNGTVSTLQTWML